MKWLFRKKGKKRTQESSFEKKMLAPKKALKVKRRGVTEKSKKGKGSFFLLVFLWTLLFGTVLYILFFSAALSTDSLRITGGSVSEQNRTRIFLEGQISGKYFGIFPRNNFFLIQEHSLERKLLDSFPLLRSVTLSQEFPDQLFADILLRKKAVLWCSGGPCYLVTEEGQVRESQGIFASEEEKQNALFVIDRSGQPVHLGQKIFDFDFVSFVADVAPHFEDRLGIRVTGEYSAFSRFAHELCIQTEEGFMVYLNTNVPLEESVDTLALLFEKEINEEQRKKLRSIDLRTENRVFYAFVGDDNEKEGAQGDEEKSDTKIQEEQEKKKP